MPTMASRPRQDPNEITQECIGISERTLEVISIAVTRGGRAIGHGRRVELGGDPETEVALKFNLFNVKCLTTAVARGVAGTAIRAELEEKAAALRAKRAANGETGNEGDG
jgi:hypothetical protein